MMKHGAVKLKNQTVIDIVSVSVVSVMLVSVNLDEITKERFRTRSWQSATSLCSKTEEAGSDLS